MKKILLATALCLMATSVWAGGLDETENTTSESKLHGQLYTSAKLFGSFMQKEAEVSGDRNSHTDYDTFRVGAGLTAGLRFDKIRTELEISRFGSTKDKEYYSAGTDRAFTKITDIYNVMINGYYDFKNKTAFTPYVGAGLGLARLRGKHTADLGYTSGYESKKKTNIAWQIGAGISYTVDKHFDIDFGYRYLDNGNVRFRYDTSKVSLKSKIHQFYTGLRFNF